MGRNIIIRFFRKLNCFKYTLFYSLLYRKDLYLADKQIVARGNINIHILPGGKLTIGEGVFFNRNVSINVMEQIKIGNNTIIGESVKMYDHNHNFRDKNRLIKEQGLNHNKIIIENNVWLGSNVVILKGVTIGTGSVIGAGCIINEDIPEYSIIVCNQYNKVSQY